MSKLIIQGEPCYRIAYGFDGRGRIAIEVATYGRVCIKTFTAGGVRYKFGAPGCPWHPTREAAVEHYLAQAGSDMRAAFHIYFAATVCEMHFEFALLSDSEDAAEQRRMEQSGLNTGQAASETPCCHWELLVKRM